MRSFAIDKFKKQARILRSEFSDRNIDITNSESLELISKINGFKDWNTARASAVSDVSECLAIAKICASESDIKNYGWQQVGQLFRINGNSYKALDIVPTATPYFEPRAIRLIGCDWKIKEKNRRFAVNAVTVGGCPQLSSFYISKDTIIGPGLISDIFKYKDPLLVRWSVFSMPGLGMELKIHVYNPNDEDILISVNIWGNPR